MKSYDGIIVYRNVPRILLRTLIFEYQFSHKLDSEVYVRIYYELVDSFGVHIISDKDLEYERIFNENYLNLDDIVPRFLRAWGDGVKLISNRIIILKSN